MKTINFCGKLSSSHLHPFSSFFFFLSASTAATYILAVTIAFTPITATVSFKVEMG
jgi:hypothetical protein